MTTYVQFPSSSHAMLAAPEVADVSVCEHGSREPSCREDEFPNEPLKAGTQKSTFGSMRGLTINQGTMILSLLSM